MNYAGLGLTSFYLYLRNNFIKLRDFKVLYKCSMFQG